jgi:hypothetical protein
MGIPHECHPCLDSIRVPHHESQTSRCQSTPVAESFSSGLGPANKLPQKKYLKKSRYFEIQLLQSHFGDQQMLTPNWLNHSGFASSYIAQRHLHLKNTAHCLFWSFLSQRRAGEFRRAGSGR